MDITITQAMESSQRRIAILCVCILYLIVLNFSRSVTACHPHDEIVLLQIKNHFHNASFFSTWVPKTDCCSWSGIKCSDGHGANPGRVTIFKLQSPNAVKGLIPPMLGNLPFLETLRINFQQHLTGSIPLTFSKLTRLQVLHLCCNHLTGPIPDFWGTFKSLNHLGLHLNYFTGSIPSSLSLLPNISMLGLFSNLLTGSIPESFGSFKTGLNLALLNNRLSGTIPRSLGEANLTHLDLSSNEFTGDASFLFARDKPLQQITLRENKFEFDFTNVDLPLSLRSIDISNNNIYGSLPKRLGQFPSLFIDVSYNQLCGRIPTNPRFKQIGPDYFAHNKCLCDVPLPPCKGI